mmetsp:Transcript_36470/g.117557  ORF Transcript_36470/g.117557 Transcript_36470/m.117557 type:complete len:221 (-) Transcript_36470:1157-1819(-)
MAVRRCKRPASPAPGCPCPARRTSTSAWAATAQRVSARSSSSGSSSNSLAGWRTKQRRRRRGLLRQPLTRRPRPPLRRAARCAAARLAWRCGASDSTVRRLPCSAETRAQDVAPPRRRQHLRRCRPLCRRVSTPSQAAPTTAAACVPPRPLLPPASAARLAACATATACRPRRPAAAGGCCPINQPPQCAASRARYQRGPSSPRRSCSLPPLCRSSWRRA